MCVVGMWETTRQLSDEPVGRMKDAWGQTELRRVNDRRAEFVSRLWLSTQMTLTTTSCKRAALANVLYGEGGRGRFCCCCYYYSVRQSVRHRGG